MNIGKEIAALKRMSPKELRERYAAVMGETTRSGNKPFLIKRIAWKLQSISEGGLSERALRRAAQLAEGAEVRLNPPATSNGCTRITAAPTKRDPRLPASGTLIEREYRGGVVRVTVLDGGFEHDGVEYKTLSAVAKAITGSHTNGFLFFRGALGSSAS